MRLENNPDQDTVNAWLEAAKDLGIRVTAPFSLVTSTGEIEIYEALVHEFGGSKGTVTGRIVGYEGDPTDSRQKLGYFASNLGLSYRQYDRDLFTATLNDWGWFGESAMTPSWYTGEVWGK
jgi:hypothetical protein